MRSFFSLIGLNIVPRVLGIATATLTEYVKLDVGSIEGNPRSGNGILSFKGIPYAQPPTGNLRWHSPREMVGWKGTLNATAFGSSCYASTDFEPYYTPPSEDCLFLNIWSGAEYATEKRPVMMWIHGGGFQFGGSAQSVYDGSNLAGEGVVIVTINYRLGVFGFLALPELDEEDTLSGDFGLQDQQLALKWVKEHISTFGGDPDNITVFGQSAGGHSIGILMSSPRSEGLFAKAILESGAFWDSGAGSIKTSSQARTQGLQFKQKLGVTSLADLRAMSATEINNAAPWNTATDPKITAFAPSIDNYVIYSAPGRVFDNGQQMKVPVLAGWTSFEQGLFLPYGLSGISKSDYETGLHDYFGCGDSIALELYPDSTPVELGTSAGDLTGDMVIREQTFTALDSHYRTAGLPSGSVWAYYFTYTSPYSPIAIHTAELPFVFGNLGSNPVFGPTEPPPSIADFTFSKTIMSYWTNFAKFGNPNGNTLPPWPEYVGGGSDLLELGDAVTADNYDFSRYRFLASFRTDGVFPERWADVNVSAIGS